MRAAGFVSAAMLVLAVSVAEAWECTWPETTDTRDYVPIDLEGLLPDSLQGAITDIVLEVESSIINLDQLRDENLINFIDALWAPEGNDIREVWNYFAAEPPTVRPRYGEWQDPPGVPAPYNFKYPTGQTNVVIRLRGGSAGGSATSPNILNIKLGDWDGVIREHWWHGERAPGTVCHEFQHTLHQCFDYWDAFEESFCEVARTVGGYCKVNIGADHGDGTHPRYDLVFNKSIIGEPTMGPPRYECHCGQTCGCTYQVWWMWPAYILNQFPGPDPNSIEDDFLYQVVRARKPSGEAAAWMYAFYLVAQDYPAPPPWDYANGTDLFRAIFNNWTIANLVDGTDFAAYNPQYSYKLSSSNYNVPLWENDDGVAGMGWLRENEDNGEGSCNQNNDPNSEMGCSTWKLPEVELPSPGVPITYELNGDGYGSAIIGIEVYAADYVKWVPSFSGDYVLRLVFNVDRVDHGNYNGGDNILIQANVVQYVGAESNPIAVSPVAMEQSGSPDYYEPIYHSVPGFSSSADLVVTIVSAMEAEVRYGNHPNYGPQTRYPTRPYSIEAIAVPATMHVTGTISQDTRWYSGQRVLITYYPGVAVARGVYLTIEPGVILEFGANCGLYVQGSLIARGNSVLPIAFTSSTHSPGAWTGIKTYASGSFLDLEHCVIEYADKGVLVSYSGSHVIENNTFRKCTYGAYLDGVTLTEFRGNSFLDNTTGVYANGSRISDEYGFRDLYFGGNQTGITFEKPVGATILRSSTFEGNQDCAIYFNQRKSLNGTFEMRDLTISAGVGACAAGIRSMGGSSQPKVRHCWIGDYATTIGISCTVAGRVDAGIGSDHGLNLFSGNDCDIEYTLRSDDPLPLSALGNCWDQEGGTPGLCGNHSDEIETSEDCSGWGGSPVPPRPAEETVARLVGVFPNPTEGSFRIAYGMGTSERVKVQIYDLSGRLVRTVVESEMPAGTHEAEWDGTDAQARAVGKGVYVCRIVGNSFVESKRLVVIR